MLQPVHDVDKSKAMQHLQPKWNKKHKSACVWLCTVLAFLSQPERSSYYHCW